MSIIPLSQSTSHRLTAAYAVQSFEDAVQQVLQHSIRFRPTVVDITVHAQALRFTVRDNRSHVTHSYIDSLVHPTAKESSCQTVVFGNPCPLPALAATSSVELRLRTPDFAAVHVVHAATTLERRLVPRADAGTVLPSTGVQVDVWQTFAAIPVRRQIELSRSVQSLTQSVRYEVVAVALANPHVSLTLYGSNNIVLFRALAEPRLSLSRIQTAFGDACHQDWVPVLVSRHSRYRVSGFIAVAGLAHARLQLLSLNSIPNDYDTLHSAVQKAWRSCFSNTATVDASHRRHAAYVINCYFVCTGQINTRNMRSPRTLSDREIHSVLSRAVVAALRRTASLSSPPLRQAGSESGTDQMNALCARPAQGHVKDFFKTGKKRPRFADAVVPPIKRKPPSSTWSNPTSNNIDFAPQFKKNVRSACDLPTRMATQKFFARGLSLRSATLGTHNWSNRCIGARPLPSPRTPVSKGDAESTCDLFNDTNVSIERESLETLRIIGQVEKKFIIVMDNSSTMYAIDQHAASERLLYERNLRKTTTSNVKSWTLPHSRKVNVSEAQKAVAEEQRSLLGKWGWTVGLTEGESTLELIQVPQLYRLAGCEDIVLRDPEQLRGFLDSLLDGAARGGLPRPFNDAIASAACHAAVRFGDILSKSQCSTLVRSLSRCENPFACAHGRPSIVPLVTLKEQGNV